MTKDNVLEVKNRSLVYNLIKKNPGVHFNKISKELDISKSTLSYHIGFLIKRSLIYESKNGRYNRYYIPEITNLKYKKVLEILRQKHIRNILLDIMLHNIESANVLCKDLEIHRNTLYKYLTKLLKMEVIEVAPSDDKYVYRADGGLMERTAKGREKFYRISSKYIDLVYDAFIIYQDSLFEDSSFSSTLDTMFVRTDRQLPKKIQSYDSAVNSILDRFYEIFPHPYHI